MKDKNTKMQTKCITYNNSHQIWEYEQQQPITMGIIIKNDHSQEDYATVVMAEGECIDDLVDI